MPNEFFQNCERDDAGHCQSSGGGGKPTRKQTAAERRRALYESTFARDPGAGPTPPRVPPSPLVLAGGGAGDKLAGIVRTLDQAGGGHNLVPLTALRQALAEAGVTDRAAQDQAIHQARVAGLITLSALEGRYGLSEEERAAAIKDETGAQLGLVSLRKALVPPSPFRGRRGLIGTTGIKSADSYFAHCERDAGGRCLPSGRGGAAAPGNPPGGRQRPQGTLGQGRQQAHQQARKQAWQAVLSGGMKAGQAAKQVAQRIGQAAWSKLPPKVQHSLARTWSAAKRVEHIAMKGFTKGKELAMAVASERGLSREHVEKVGKIIAIADQALTWSGATFAAGAAVGGVLTGKVAAYLPVASLAYVAYSGARNPFALVRAARATLRHSAASGGTVAHKALALEELRDAVEVLLERAGDEWFLALVHAAWDEVHDLAEAVRLAEEASATSGEKSLPPWSVKSNVPGTTSPGGPSAEHPMGKDTTRYGTGKRDGMSSKPARTGGPHYLTGPMRALQQTLSALAPRIEDVPPEVRRAALYFAADQYRHHAHALGQVNARKVLAAASLLAAAPLPGADPRAFVLVEGSYLACEHAQLKDNTDPPSANDKQLAGAALEVLRGWYLALGAGMPHLDPDLARQALALAVGDGEDGGGGDSFSGEQLDGKDPANDGRVVPRGTTQENGKRFAQVRPSLRVPPSPFRGRGKSLPYDSKGSWFSDCPRDDHGRCLPKGAAGGGKAGGSAPAPPSGEPRQARPQAKHVAKLSHFTSPAIKRRITHALRNEAEFSEATGGWNVPDSAAFDVVIAVNPGGEFVDKPDRLRSLLRQREDALRRLKTDPEGPQAQELRQWLDSHQVYAVEVKTLWTAANDKVRMSPKATARKERYAERVGATSATVVFDDRKGKKHSGNRLYVKQGVGTLRLADAHAVGGFDEALEKLLGGEKT
jgi:hypothetical protein